MSKYCEDTGFLFATPSWLQGVASALDLGGTLVEYNVSKTPEEADIKAIASDWAITGKDIKKTAETVEKHKKKKKKKKYYSLIITKPKLTHSSHPQPRRKPPNNCPFTGNDF